MKPTIPYLQQKIDEYNKQMFGGKLPPVPVLLVDVKTFLGVCTYKKRTDLSGNEEKYDFCLKFSTRIDLSEQELEDTIIHELIHYYIGVTQQQDGSSHGPLFRSIMESINQMFDRHLTISHKNTQRQSEQAIDKTRRYHIVAVVRFVDGRFGIKILPRVLPSVLKFHNAYNKDSLISGVELYMTNNPYFNQFPNSAALKVHIVNELEVMDNLKGSENIICDGKTVRLK